MPRLTVICLPSPRPRLNKSVLRPLRAAGIDPEIVELDPDNPRLRPDIPPEALSAGSLIVLSKEVHHEVHHDLVRRREQSSKDAVSFRVVRAVTAEEQRSRHRMALPLAGGDDRARTLLELTQSGEGPILLEGETGTGKTQAARALHNRLRSDRSKPFIAMNCASLKENVQEAELRGVVKGSFTDVGERASVFERCNGGTLLLDDFQDLSKAAQATLLDLVDPFSNGVAGTRFGGEKQWEADVQLVVAVNRSPVRMVREGELRKDLLFRIPKQTRFPTLRGILRSPKLSVAKRKHVLRQIMLAMQERAFVWPEPSEDVFPSLSTAFQLQPPKKGSGMDRGQIRSSLTLDYTWADVMPIPDEALSYDWPGNYRELDAFARALLYSEYGQPKVGLWSTPEFNRELTRHEESYPTVTAATDATKRATPERHLALAWLTVLTEPGTSIRRVADCFDIDARTAKKYLANPSEHLPLDALNSNERDAALWACRTILT